MTTEIQVDDDDDDDDILKGKEKNGKISSSGMVGCAVLLIKLRILVVW